MADEGGGTWYNQSFTEWYAKVYDTQNSSEIFGERYTAAQVQWIFYSIASLLVPLSNDVSTCVFTGEITGDACKNIIQNTLKPNEQSDEQTNIQKKSLFAAIFENRPVSGIYYIKNIGSKFHLIPEANAQNTQGFGFGSLSVVLDLWRASRNIAYAMFVLVIVVLSFMIMFRVKISPQTVISVQSALPRVAIALVLITFSYALAGFLVDLMYVFYGLLSLVIASSGQFLSSNPVAIFDFMTKGAVSIAGHTLPSFGIFGLFIIYAILFGVALFYVLFAGGGLLSGIVGAIFTLGATIPLYSILSILAMVILVIIFLWAFAKTLWLLFKTFAMILILTIAAPFQMALGAISPSFGFSGWLRAFISNLAVFPVVSLLFTFSFLFIIYTFKYVSQEVGFSSPWTSLIPGGSIAFQSGWPPLLGATSKTVAFAFLGASLAIMLLIPKAADIIKSMIEGKPFTFGTAIGESAQQPLKGGAAISGLASSRFPAGSTGQRTLSKISEILGSLGGYRP